MHGRRKQDKETDITGEKALLLSVIIQSAPAKVNFLMLITRLKLTDIEWYIPAYVRRTFNLSPTHPLPSTAHDRKVLVVTSKRLFGSLKSKIAYKRFDIILLD